MDRLVEDDPQTNTEVLFNLAYVKDKEVWIRGGGDDGEDCTLIDFTNRMCASHDCLFDITPNEIDEEDIDNTGDRLLECSMSGCPIGTAYFIAIQAAELRERLRQYEEKQEPRVMVSSEIQPDDLVWIEVPQSDEIWPALLRKTDWFGHPTWAMRGYALGGYYLHDGYGRDWRCWTAKPTEDQRLAVKWDD